jgi:hypothetical protein
VYHYQITLESGSEYLQTRGKISVTLIGTLQTVTTIFDKYVNGNIYKKKKLRFYLVIKQYLYVIQYKHVLFH